VGGTVRAHGIQGYPHRMSPRSVLVNVENRFVPVMPTCGTDAVREFGIATARTALGVHRFGFDMGPTLPLPLF